MRRYWHCRTALPATMAFALPLLLAAAGLRVPSLLASDMVLPAAPRVARLWGSAEPGAAVDIAASGAHSGSYTAKAAADGTWEVGLRAQAPSLELSTITISSGGSITIKLERVLFGDLIVCGGQSNMQFSLNLAFNGSAEIAAAGNYSHNLRLATVARVLSTKPVTSPKLTQPWSISSPHAVDDGKPFGVFSAECYLAGRMLLDLRPSVPIGLISSCWSGSMIQPWMPTHALDACPAAKAKGSRAPFSDSQMFNAMIAPLTKFEPAAVLWHQGEENAGNPVEYHCFFKALITEWRAAFALPRLPFSFVQLQPCGVPPAQRYAQAAALELPMVGMATAIDLLDPGQAGAPACPAFVQSPSCPNPNGMCHTRWKHEIAERLVAVTAPMIFNTSTKDATSVAAAQGGLVPATSPRVGKFVAIRAKDYRTYFLTFAVDGGGSGLSDLSIGGTKECQLCCDAPAFALEFASNAPGEHWQAVGTKPDKHGVPVTYNATTRELVVLVVVEPPWLPSKLRHSWQDAPQCVLFGRPSGMPVPPFNMSWSPPGNGNYSAVHAL